MAIPTRVVVDTNVATTANGMNDGAPLDCVAASARALQHVIDRGHLYLDNDGAIVSEYRAHLSAAGQPGPGDVFLKWVLTHEWDASRVTRVAITPSAGDAQDYEELPAPTGGIAYDRSDRKFLAVAVAHRNHPALLQSFDSKWWGWQAALDSVGVVIHFNCPEAIESKYREKMG